MENAKRRLGQKIRARRIELGIKTQAKLETLLGIDRSRISDWETGMLSPGPILAEKLKAVLHVDDSFFEESQEPETISFEKKKLELIRLILQIDNTACLDVATTALTEIVFNQRKLGSERNPA